MGSIGFIGFIRAMFSSVSLSVSFSAFFKSGSHAHRLDLMTVNTDKLNAAFTLKTQNKFIGGAKKLRRLRPFAGTKARTLILLLARVAAAQCDLCVIAVIFDEELLAVSNIVRVRHKNCP
jgi:hypothetical protein